MATPSTVEAYLAELPAAQRAVMEQLRKTIRAAAPEATEVISYAIPTLRLHDRLLVSYAAFKAHVSVFPASDAVIEAVGADLEPYLAGKATIRFPSSKPIPIALVTKVVQARVRELRAAQ
jgi:uncharacterized protein YdhG (YjbR/CyaY superfamily)